MFYQRSTFRASCSSSSSCSSFASALQLRKNYVTTSTRLNKTFDRQEGGTTVEQTIGRKTAVSRELRSRTRDPASLPARLNRWKHSPRRLEFARCLVYATPSLDFTAETLEVSNYRKIDRAKEPSISLSSIILSMTKFDSVIKISWLLHNLGYYHLYYIRLV